MGRIRNVGCIVPVMAVKPGSRSFSAATRPEQMLSRWIQITLAFYMYPSGKLIASHTRLSVGAKTAVSSSQLMVAIPGPRSRANLVCQQECWVRSVLQFRLLERTASGLLSMHRMEQFYVPKMGVSTGIDSARIAICALVRGIT